jgi:cytochrome P450
MNPTGTLEPRTLGERYDPFRGPQLADPYPFFAEARAATPVFYCSHLDCWVVTRYEDIYAVFQAPKVFSASNVLTPIHPVCPEARRILDGVGFRPVPILTDNDPPAHTRARRLANVAFTPRRVASMEGFIRDLVVRFTEERFSSGRADLIRDLAWDLPVLVLFRVLGVPEEDVARIKSGSGNRLLFMWGRPDREQQVQLAEGIAGFWRYARELVAARAQDPRDDFTSDLLAARSGDLPAFTREEVTSIIVILLAAGHETTTNLLGNAFRLLLTHRDAWVSLCRDRSLIPNAIEEVLRLESSVISWRRRTTQAVEIGGVPIPAGANLLLWIGSANRDPAVFEEPDHFDIRRPNAKEHLSFGSGPHFCLGAPLARLEARVVLEELSARLPGLRLVPGAPLQFQPNTSFRGPLSLPAEWDL